MCGVDRAAPLSITAPPGPPLSPPLSCVDAPFGLLLRCSLVVGVVLVLGYQLLRKRTSGSLIDMLLGGGGGGSQSKRGPSGRRQEDEDAGDHGGLGRMPLRGAGAMGGIGGGLGAGTGTLGGRGVGGFSSAVGGGGGGGGAGRGGLGGELSSADLRALEVRASGAVGVVDGGCGCVCVGGGPP